MSSNWIHHDTPAHTSFTVHDTNLVTALVLWKQRIVTSSDDNSIRVWNTDGTLVRSLEGHTGGVWGLALHGDTLVSVSQDRSVRIWDLETGVCSHIFTGHSNTVRCIAIAEPDAAKRPVIVTGSRDGAIHVWSLPAKDDAEFKGAEDAPNPYHLFQLQGHTDSIRDISVSGKIAASGSYDNTVRVWDVVSGECLWTLEGHTDKVYSTAVDLANNQVFSGSMDRTIRVWNLTDGTCKSVLKHHSSLIGLLSISASYLFSGAPDCRVCVWDLKTLEVVQTINHKGAITAIQGDDTKFVSGSSGLVRVVDIKTAETKDLLSMDKSKTISQVAYAGGLCVAVTKDGGNSVDVWDFGSA